MEHIFKIWDTLADMAADLGKPYPTVSAWRQRGSIPARYDLAIVQAAAKRGRTVTFEQISLARASASKSKNAA